MIDRPSEREDDYFKRAELEKVRRLREAAAAELEEAERQRRKELHWMSCPKCGLELAEVAFRGVTVDACFACGGMFLDQGEIEKIVAFREPGTLKRMVGTLFGRETLPSE